MVSFSTRKSAESLFLLLAGMSVLFFRYGDYWSEHWLAKFSLLAGMGMIGFSAWISSLTSRWFFPIIAVATLSGAWVGIYPYNQYISEPNLGYREALSHDSLYALLCVMLSCVFITQLPKRLFESSRSLLASIFGMSVFYTYWELLTHWDAPNERGAFSGNPSMNGVLIACLLPFVLKRCKSYRSQFLWIGVALGSVLAAVASIPLGCLGIVLIVYYRSMLGGLTKSVLLAAGVSTALCLVGLYFQGGMLFNSSGRFEAWSQIMSDWWDQANVIFGTGLGTTLHIGGQYQLSHRIPGETGRDIFLWLHNDWLQTLFELGFLGFGALILAWGTLYKRVLQRPDLMASFLGFSAAAFFNYPLRLPLHALSIVVVVTLILREGVRV